MQQASSPQPYHTITTHRVPLRACNLFNMLLFEWAQFLYYVYLFTSILFFSSDGQEMHPHSAYNGRVLVYCLLFLLFDKLELTYKYLELQDPLHLGSTIRAIRYGSFLCIGNMSALLARIVLEQPNMHAFMVAMHYLLIMGLFLNEFSKKNSKLDINVDSNNVFSKYVTPLSLFIFNKTSTPHPYHTFWHLQLTLLAVNIFLSAELNRILVLKECQYFGWLEDGSAVAGLSSNKEKRVWSRRRALRGIIVVCCVMVVGQNLMLVIQKIKGQIGVIIVHTFIVSAMSYVLYTGHLPLNK